MDMEPLFAVLELVVGWDIEWSLPDLGYWRWFEAWGSSLEFWGINR